MQASDLKTPKALKENTQDLTLSSREKHLIGLAVTLTKGCKACSSRRFKEALEDGITKQELIDLSDLVALTNAGVVARTALDSWDEPTCEDNVCAVS